MTGVPHNKLQLLHQGIAFVVGESHFDVYQPAFNIYDSLHVPGTCHCGDCSVLDVSAH